MKLTICHKSGEMWENCDIGRTPEEGNENQEGEGLQVNKGGGIPPHIAYYV